MQNQFFLRNGPAVWPLDVRSVGKQRHEADPLAARPQGAPFCILMWTLEGAGFLEVDGQRHILEKGWLFVLPPNAAHTYGPLNKDSIWLVQWFTLDGPLCAGLLKSLEMDKPLVLQIGTPSDALFQQFLKTSNDSSLSGGMERAQLAVRLLYEIHARMKGMLGTVRTTRFQELVETAGKTISMDLNVDSLARQAGLTRSHFSRLFTLEMGMTPARFVMDTKLGKARELLLNTGKPVKTIARECGFFDTAHFSRQFNRIVGLTPTAFRKHNSI